MKKKNEGKTDTFEKFGIAGMRGEIEKICVELETDSDRWNGPELKEALKALHHANAMLQALAVASV